jgi:hypothetical protein
VNKNKERILCAAIWYDDKKYYASQPQIVNGTGTGVVISGYRHDRIRDTLMGLFGDNYDKRLMTQGFLTSHNRFVNRGLAWDIFFETNPDHKFFLNGELYSEDLY